MLKKEIEQLATLNGMEKNNQRANFDSNTSEHINFNNWPKNCAPGDLDCAESSMKLKAQNSFANPSHTSAHTCEDGPIKCAEKMARDSAILNDESQGEKLRRR